MKRRRATAAGIGLAALLLVLAGVRTAVAEERTVTGTVVRLDRGARTFSVVDGMGARWNFKVLPDADIDLSPIREGDRVSVSIARGTPLNMMTTADHLRKGDTVVKIPF